jgi:hypothetical protein
MWCPTTPLCNVISCAISEIVRSWCRLYLFRSAASYANGGFILSLDWRSAQTMRAAESDAFTSG